MISDMQQVRMTEPEVTNNFAAVLEKLRQGDEVIVTAVQISGPTEMWKSKGAGAVRG